MTTLSPRTLIRRLSLSTLALVLGASLASASYIHVDGVRIVRDGQPVALRGFGALLNSTEPADFQTMKRWGYSLVRCDLSYADFSRAQGDLDPAAAGWKHVRTFLDGAKRANLAVVFTVQGAPGPTDPNNRLRDFWVKLATEHAGNTQVLGYELAGGSASDTVLGALIRDVRAVDAHHILIVSGTHAAFGDSNMVYGVRVYAPRGLPADAAQGSERGDYYPSVEPGRWIQDAEFAWLPDGSQGWTSVRSAEFTTAATARFASVDAYVDHTRAAVRFDDLGILVNGETHLVRNSGFESAGDWFYTGAGTEDKPYRITSEDHRSGASCVEMSREPAWAVLASGERVRVRAGDRLRALGWIKPLGTAGRVAVKIALYDARVYDSAALRAALLPEVRWAQSRAVPLWISDWGIADAAPPQDTLKFLQEMTTLLGEWNLPWAQQVWRDSQSGISRHATKAAFFERLNTPR